MLTKNIRHSIDPAVVADAVARKLADIDGHSQHQTQIALDLTAQYLRDVESGSASKNWTHKPSTSDDVERRRLEARAEEEGHYAKVRVVELPQEGPRFILVYGDANDDTVTSGTGPFETFELAVGWFTRLGR